MTTGIDEHVGGFLSGYPVPYEFRKQVGAIIRKDFPHLKKNLKYKLKFGRYPVLYREAQRIAKITATRINQRARVIKEPDMPYKAQGILEMVVHILTEAI